MNSSKERKAGNYSQIGVDKTTFADLMAMKEERAEAIGVTLSWNQYFKLLLRDLRGAKTKR
jgi:hypothetical protein